MMTKNFQTFRRRMEAFWFILCVQLSGIIVSITVEAFLRNGISSVRFKVGSSDGRLILLERTSPAEPNSLSTIEKEDDNPVYHTSSFWGSGGHTEKDIVDFLVRNVLDGDSSRREDIEVVSVDPPLMYIHDFIDETVCDEIVKAAELKSLYRSTVGSEQNEENIRTSTQAWLREDDEELNSSGHKSPVNELRHIATKVSKLTCLPPDHQENLQVVRYEAGQQFDIHLDHLDEFNDLEVRGRVATCLMYLNDGFEGGETFFPEFNFKAIPKKGSATFWFNTIEKPGGTDYNAKGFLTADEKLRHAGLVTNGTKYICNRWVSYDLI